jgi:hypothetical protein
MRASLEADASGKEGAERAMKPMAAALVRSMKRLAAIRPKAPTRR